MSFWEKSPEEIRQRMDEYMAYVRSGQRDRDVEEMKRASKHHVDSEDDRRRDARLLLRQGSPFVRIENGDDGPSLLAITFDDVAAVAFEDFVAETVEIARQFPGVIEAWHEDREVIVLSGNFDAASLEHRVRDWWVGRLEVVAQESADDEST